MGYNLFLDDFRVPRDAYMVCRDPRYNTLEWVPAINYDEFVALIETKGVPDLVAFDHDLADEHYDKCQKFPADIKYDELKEKTCCHAARFLVEHCLEKDVDIPDYLIHTQNYGGGLNIRSVMESGKKVQKMQRDSKNKPESQNDDATRP